MKLFLEYHFDAAHRLTFHKGKCANLHGHRWEVKVDIESNFEIEDDMIVDFGEIKKVIDSFDHCTILYDCETNKELIEILENMGNKVIRLHYEPTAENLAVILWNKLELLLVEHYNKLIVTVYESPGSGVNFDGY